jgi:hypothetical protein
MEVLFMNDLTKSAEHPAALKEWASAIRALGEGKQIIVLRKGGIIEETRDFQLIKPRFFLLPTYEHQREELLKPEFRHFVGESLTDWSSAQQTVKLEFFAEAVEDLEVTDQAMLDLLRGHHIWTDAFAEERLRWKRTKPLHVLLLRVWKLEHAMELPLHDSYTGCKSWVSLEDRMLDMPMSPVLEEGQFWSEVEAIKKTIAGEI